ncbi:2-keto-4-pentenoate hydratase [Asaia lannensis]|uniref:2-keto-4-pentenoate hydratase n=1 Tax=Asaia lannensis NBRC 102526 TaxID=1307926 RepID=A0ABT1CET6_9PROT|nr:2-keto-4-pentenoate hydratase [Asaia lannensis]MCO6159375.1 2-keto-4-pentenoate hydratase [Asaia lannensis NBRC 102526]GBQ98151.1 2-oxopent-4-enoate hydratase [Asaia lannensis NBRC 102526]
MMLFDDCMSPGVVSSVLHPAAAKFLKVRAGADPLSALLLSDAPRDEAEAYLVQDQLARAMVPDQGAVCGWKVGAPAPEAEPFAAPLHHATLFDGDTELPRGLCKHFGVEAELVYRFHRDLPARERPWTLNEVLDAIGSIHTAIEIIDTRFEQPNTQPRLAHLADQASHGALVIGRGSESWRRLSPVCETVRLALSDGRVIEHIGGNSAGDPRRLLVWLANHAAARGLPILAGHSVTTGSMTDTIFVPPGTTATAQIAHLPPVTLTIPDA